MITFLLVIVNAIIIIIPVYQVTWLWDALYIPIKIHEDFIQDHKKRWINGYTYHVHRREDLMSQRCKCTKLT